MANTITHERLLQILDYDPETGYFIWIEQVGQRTPLGEVAGHFDKDGYRIIQLGGIKYRAGRLVWFYMTKTWPIEVDHEDGIYDNDAWYNLREATRSQNVANSNRETGISGLRGVKFDPRTTSWRAKITFGYCSEWLGPFDTAEEAYTAYLAAAEIRHGEFALHNRPTTNPGVP